MLESARKECEEFSRAYPSDLVLHDGFPFPLSSSLFFSFACLLARSVSNPERQNATSDGPKNLKLRMPALSNPVVFCLLSCL